jgi:two-component system NtrC family sensor kinase
MSNPSVSSDRILIIGDEAKSASALERLLKAAGYSARFANSFLEAQTELSAQEYALIIIEPSASRLSGSHLQTSFDDSGESVRRLAWALQSLDFCQDMRKNIALAELPVMVISKSHRPQDKVACLNAGATDFLSKPYQRTELLSMVRAHLRSWHHERERSERFEQLNVLHAVSSVLTSSLEPDYLLKGTLSVLCEKMPADAGAVYMLSEETNTVNVTAIQGFSLDDEKYLIDLYSSISSRMNGCPVVFEPVPEEFIAGLDSERKLTQSPQGIICAPLKLAGNKVGAIYLFFNRKIPFPGQRAELLSTVCNNLTVAIENARLYVETKRSAAQLSFVYNLGNNLMTSLEMDELLGYTVFTVGKSLSCDICAVIVRSTSQPDNLISAIYGGTLSDYHNENAWFVRESVERYLSNTDESMQPLVEVRSNDRYLSDETIANEMIAPLMFDDALLGVLICGSRSIRAFSADAQKLLGAVAQQLSLAIRNTELYQRIKDTSINLAVEVSKRTREIEEQKRFTEKIIDSLPVSLYVVDRDMQIVAWNRNRELGGQGISRDEVLGRKVFNVLARQPRRMLEEEFTDVFRTARMMHVEQESWMDGQKKYWKISKIPMRVDNAEVTHVITVGEDITEQKKMNEAVIYSEKLASIGRLAAGVVHELNNPLATVAACAEALIARLDELTDAELLQDFSEYLQIVRDEAFRCKTITNNLLDFSNQRQAEKLLADINQIIDQTLQLTKHHPKLGKMSIVRELDSSVAPVLVNEGQMKQIFIALISNAYDAMEGTGTLTIRTGWHETENERCVAIGFTDTGCGIPAQNLPKIFDPFFTTKPLGRGTGLGLSVCYGIVSEHGGKIEVDSVMGNGSTFRVLLPVTAEAARYQVARPSRNEVPRMEIIQ